MRCVVAQWDVLCDEYVYEEENESMRSTGRLLTFVSSPLYPIAHLLRISNHQKRITSCRGILQRALAQQRRREHIRLVDAAHRGAGQCGSGEASKTPQRHLAPWLCPLFAPMSHRSLSSLENALPSSVVALSSPLCTICAPLSSSCTALRHPEWEFLTGCGRGELRSDGIGGRSASGHAKPEAGGPAVLGGGAEREALVCKRARRCELEVSPAHDRCCRRNGKRSRFTRREGQAQAREDHLRSLHSVPSFCSPASLKPCQFPNLIGDNSHCRFWEFFLRIGVSLPYQPTVFGFFIFGVLRRRNVGDLRGLRGCYNSGW